MGFIFFGMFGKEIKMVILKLFLLMVFFGLVISVGIVVWVDGGFFFYEENNEIMILKFKFSMFEEGLKIKDLKIIEME